MTTLDEGGKKMAKQKIRIRLKAYEHRALDQSAEKSQKQQKELVLAQLVQFHCLQKDRYIQLFVRLTNIKILANNFEMRTHKRLIDIVNPTPKTVDALMKLDLPSGVDIEIKL